MIAVLDTNVLISATLREGSVPWQALHAVLRRGTHLMSDTTVNGFHRVISRPRFDRFVSWSVRMEIFAGVVLLSEGVDILTPVVACRDPNDDMFLEVAVNGAADYLVSGDADLLALHPFRGVTILSPTDFLAAVGVVQ